MFTTIAAYLDPIEAQLALGRLQAEGIPARLDDSGTAIANWEWRLAIGGMRLRVPEEQALHARRVLAALDAGEYALDDGPAGDDQQDSDKALAPLQPPSRESLSSRLAWVALMLFGLPLPWRRDRDDDDAAVRRA